MDDFIKDGFKDQRIIRIPETVTNSFTDDGLLKRLYITDIGFFPNANYHKIHRKQGAKVHICIFCIDGKGWIRTPEGLLTLKEREFTIIPANTPHSYGSTLKTPWSIYWFHFSGDDSNEIVMDYGNKIVKTELDSEQSIFFIENFDHIYLMLEKGYNRGNLVVIFRLFGYLLTRTIIIFQNNRHLHGRATINVELSIDFMRKNLNANISLSNLAEDANLSIQQYSLIFKKITGYSPIHYFQLLKIQKACFMLDTTLLNISEVAQLVGYEDPLYFSRIFKKINGKSPREYRKIKKG